VEHLVNKLVILSGVTASRSEAVTESKDPYPFSRVSKAAGNSHHNVGVAFPPVPLCNPVPPVVKALRPNQFKSRMPLLIAYSAMSEPHPSREIASSHHFQPLRDTLIGFPEGINVWSTW